MDIQCLRCKGRGFCGRSQCPHILKSNSYMKARSAMPDRDFQGTSPAPFIGRAGYPYVNVGILSPPEPKDDAWLYDAPRYWGTKSFSIPQIMDYRSALINSRLKADIRQTSGFLELAREVGMAGSPVELDINLIDKPRFALNSDSVMAPYGPSAELRGARITSNPKIHPKVDRAFSDTDLKASEAIIGLYGEGFDENFLSKMLSVGSLGIKTERKLVPTRWSITASDDMISKSVIADLKDNSLVNDWLAYHGSYLGNHYIVLLFPEIWGYELFETYMPMASWNTGQEVGYTTDHEGYEGRKNYAENCAGGYYSVRLAVAESLARQGRQARAVVIRVITGEYSVPLGVWVTREAARKALHERPIAFDSMDLMLKYVASFCRKKFGLDASLILMKSVLINSMRTQRKLNFS